MITDARAIQFWCETYRDAKRRSWSREEANEVADAALDDFTDRFGDATLREQVEAWKARRESWE